MTEDAVDKIIALAARAQHKKADQWATVKTQAPDVAALLTDLNALLGKPAGIRIVLNDRIIIDTLPDCPHRKGVNL